jgi:tRNA (guanine37-N1)-methyltransferase
MKMTVLTLFPELITAVAQASITGRAIKSGLIEVDTVQIRDFAVNTYGQVDDTLYGGGVGMLIRPEPIYKAWQSVIPSAGATGMDNQLDIPPALCAGAAGVRTIHLSPKGRVLNQKIVEELASCDQLILLCGHYEGIDQRVIDEIVDEELSIGDYVLTGGEIAANVLIDAVARLIPGVLPSSAAHEQETHSLGRLEQPQYTRPANWQGHLVPDVLTSGHQAKIDRYQYLASLQETLVKRPDLFNQMQLSAEDYRELIEFYCQNRKALI